MSHVTVSGDWKDQGNDVTCHGCWGLQGEGNKSHMLRFLGCGGNREKVSHVTVCLALLCFALHCFALHCFALLCFALLCFAFLHCLVLLSCERFSPNWGRARFILFYCLRFAIPAEAISGTRQGTLELQDSINEK